MLENITHLTREERIKLNKVLAKQFTKLMMSTEVEFKSSTFRGIAVVKSILPPKTTSICDEFRVKIKVIKYEERKWPDFISIDRPTRYKIRNANRDAKYCILKEVRKYSQFFSIRDWRVKAETVEYCAVKK